MYANRVVGSGGSVVGVDLVPPTLDIQQRSITFLQQDIDTWDPEPIYHRRFTTIVSDVAPSTTGIHVQDAYISSLLCLRILELCGILYTPDSTNTHLLMKCYQGEHFPTVLQQMRSRFQHAQTFKPKSSRPSSKEIYIYGRGFVPRTGVHGGLDTVRTACTHSHNQVTVGQQAPIVTYDDGMCFTSTASSLPESAPSHTTPLFTTARKIARYRRKMLTRNKEFVATKSLYAGDEVFTPQLCEEFQSPHEMLHRYIRRYTDNSGRES
uniref:rRNA methyltransferase 2, mitochondrial n=1 Tax=Lygus hesperus TaxID=30085 RepID=A0A146MAH2_LYGHE